MIDLVRAVCLALPEATEQETWGHPTFRVRSKIFAMLQIVDGRMGIWCKSEMELQRALVAADPERYFVPPYLGHKGWLGIRLEADIDIEVIAEHIEESYRAVAPKRLVALL